MEFNALLAEWLYRKNAEKEVAPSSNVASALHSAGVETEGMLSLS